MSIAAQSKVLIIDDDVDLLRNVKRVLERCGYLVLVHDGSPGCHARAIDFQPNLVLVDLRMPFLSGESFVALFGRTGDGARPTVVLYSAVDEYTLERKTRECGADGYIPKSDSGLEFARKVAGYLSKDPTTWETQRDVGSS